MPLLHQAVTRSFRLNCQAVEHARLADCEIADINHLLHFAFAFCDNFSRLERDELAELVFQFAQCVTKTANSVAAYRTRSRTPFQERFLSTRNRLVVIIIRCGTHTCDSPPINRRNLVDLRSATAPFAIEDAFVNVSKTKLFENRLHNLSGGIPRLRDAVHQSSARPAVAPYQNYFRLRQNCRIESIASSTTSAVMSSGGRNRIEFSPDRSVSTPRSKRPFQNSSRVFASGRSKARNSPRPRAAEISGSSFCRFRSRTKKYPPTFSAFSTKCSFSTMRRK